MPLYQVYAVYPSGNAYPVREPHATREGARWHVECCRKQADPRDGWRYAYSEIQPCRDCGKPFPYDPEADRCPACIAEMMTR